MKLIICVLLSMMFLSACSDATIANLTTYGSQGHVRCYSGGQLIYDGISTGKIKSESNSDGWQFVDSKTGMFVRVSGDCIVEN
jgi:hypothetical protein